MVRVDKGEDESFESLLRRFRKRVTNARILSTVRKKRFYTPPSEERRIARRKAIRRANRQRWRQERG